MAMKKFINSPETITDEIVVCSGYVSAIPPIPGVNGKNVKTAMDVLLDHSDVGENVVLMGSGMVGCETAIDLAMAGKKVSLVELAPTLGNEILVSMRKTIENVYHKLAKSMPPEKTTDAFQAALDANLITEKEKDLWYFVLSAYGDAEFSTKQLEKDFGNAAYATIRSFVLKFEELGLLSSQKYGNRVKYRV